MCRLSSASDVLSAVEDYDAIMWLLDLWKEISGRDLDALLVTGSESLQHKEMSTAFPTGKGFGSTWLCFVKVCVYKIWPGVGGLVEQPGESTNEGSS
jgi:hypothetical protein